MLSMVIITLGVLEFIFGCVLSIFPKSINLGRVIKFLYDFSDAEEKVIPILNKWIGENCALVGSFYTFSGSLISVFDLSWVFFILIITLVEVYSYKRINRGIIKILDDSQ